MKIQVPDNNFICLYYVNKQLHEHSSKIMLIATTAVWKNVNSTFVGNVTLVDSFEKICPQSLFCILS